MDIQQALFLLRNTDMEIGKDQDELTEFVEQQEAQLLYLKANADGEKIAREALQEELDQQAQYAELGRLVLKVKPCYFGYDFRDGDCLSVRCSKDEAILCKAWNELMAEGCE